MPDRLPKFEFIVLMAMMFATIAFSIDSMLPALPEIADELSPDAPNRAQLILTSFVLGMGIGTMFTGPLSDTFGRRRVIFGGSVLFIAAALVAAVAPSLELVLIARVLQGLGAAAPRVAALAIIRDLYEGRQMAQLMSFVMLVFTLVPAIAPTIGAVLIWGFGWRSVFIAFVVFSVASVSWLALRQRETLAPENQRPFRLAVLWSGIREMMAIRRVVLATMVLTLVFGILFTTLSVTQPIFDVTFGRADDFHLWFGAIAIVSGSASILNARIVLSLGMRRVITWTLGVVGALSILMAMTAMTAADSPFYFPLYVGWVIVLFSCAGLTIGNLNALAMEPLGHLAGLAASVIGSIATVGAVLIAVPVGLAFDGTPLPAAIGVLICAGVGFVLIRQIDDLPIAAPTDQET